jgi:hypothetical protein
MTIWDLVGAGLILTMVVVVMYLVISVPTSISAENTTPPQPVIDMGQVKCPNCNATGEYIEKIGFEEYQQNGYVKAYSGYIDFYCKSCGHYFAVYNEGLRDRNKVEYGAGK